MTWFILKSQQKFGPYSYEDMVRLKQNNQLYDFDYVWKSGYKVWMPVAHVDELSSSRLIQWLEENPKRKNELVARATPRVLIETPLMCHNKINLWKGNTHSLSLNGALVTMNNPYVLPSNQVHIHFEAKSVEDLAFSVVGEVLGKKYSTQRLKYNSPLQYTVRFISKDAGAEFQIQEWIDKKLKGA